jgi:SAM-dependent methyltransferase
MNLDFQLEYWNTEGTRKVFGHPLNLERVSQWLTHDDRILDFGCGYGRSLGELSAAGYRNLIGFDFSPAMIAAARTRFPQIEFRELDSGSTVEPSSKRHSSSKPSPSASMHAFRNSSAPSPGGSIPLPDASVAGAFVFSVLTCIPTDDGQRALIAELHRVLRPGGLLYISDLWLQSDERNLTRYARDAAKYGKFGVFDLPEGVTVRHHDPAWIGTLTRDFQKVALDDIEVLTMNRNPAKAFQWFGLKKG